MMNRLRRAARRLNWAARQWSTERDRQFHDALFAGHVHDPFSDSYPGRLTIRRFADLASQHVRRGDYVVDLGCGPGEITCELARRLSTSRFVGVDHSAQAISRAGQLAAEAGLTNVRFERHDVEQYDLPQGVGIVMMFDAFHHMRDPAEFVERLGRSCDRFFLIEPAGDWLGRWRRSLDLDWLSNALLTIRDRLEYQFDLAPVSRPAPQAAACVGEPIEHRYALEDFYRWFQGFGVEIRGTVAGLETYGADPYAKSDLRDEVGRALYNLVVEVEDVLRRHDLDLGAKHWAIYAERGRTVPMRVGRSVPTRSVDHPIAGPYDVEYVSFDGPRSMAAGTFADATVKIVNRSWRLWDSFAAENPVLVSYHWLDAQGETIVEDGLRSPLPRPVAPGETCEVAVRIQSPDEPGRLTLAIDLVHEHVTWFSRAGAPPLRIAMRVTTRGSAAPARS